MLGYHDVGPVTKLTVMYARYGCHDTMYRPNNVTKLLRPERLCEVSWTRISAHKNVYSKKLRLTFGSTTTMVRQTKVKTAASPKASFIDA